MRQRVSIAPAFAVDPEILLCDEPFSALDEVTARDLHSEFSRLVRQGRKTAAFVTPCRLAIACSYLTGPRGSRLKPKFHAISMRLNKNICSGGFWRSCQAGSDETGSTDEASLQIWKDQ
jgi:hypothetical protein